jgi:hypothetical protein
MELTGRHTEKCSSAMRLMRNTVRSVVQNITFSLPEFVPVPYGARVLGRTLTSLFSGLLDHTHTDTRQDSSGRVISPSQRPLPTQDNTTYKHNRQTSMPRAGFEPAIPATKRPQIYALDRAGTKKTCRRWDSNQSHVPYVNISILPCCLGYE